MTVVYAAGRQERFSTRDPLGLTRLQRRILEVLWSDPEAVHTHEAICDAVWEFTPRSVADFQLVRVNVARLRLALRKARAVGRIVTHKGRGYSWSR